MRFDEFKQECQLQILRDTSAPADAYVLLIIVVVVFPLPASPLPPLPQSTTAICDRD